MLTLSLVTIYVNSTCSINGNTCPLKTASILSKDTLFKDFKWPEETHFRKMVCTTPFAPFWSTSLKSALLVWCSSVSFCSSWWNCWACRKHSLTSSSNKCNNGTNKRLNTYLTFLSFLSYCLLVLHQFRVVLTTVDSICNCVGKLYLFKLLLVLLSILL